MSFEIKESTCVGSVRIQLTQQLLRRCEVGPETDTVCSRSPQCRAEKRRNGRAGSPRENCGWLADAWPATGWLACLLAEGVYYDKVLIARDGWRLLSSHLAYNVTLHGCTSSTLAANCPRCSGFASRERTASFRLYSRCVVWMFYTVQRLNNRKILSHSGGKLNRIAPTNSGVERDRKVFSDFS